MNEVPIYARIIATILGVAYPILFQLISKLDEKYSSNLIVELFDKEKEKKWFKNVLILSLVSIFIWSFKFQPLIQVTALDFLIENSAALLVVASGTTLVTVFFLYISKILIYYNPTKFVSYLVSMQAKNPSDLTYFTALGDVFLHAIKKNNEGLALSVYRYYADSFRRIRDLAQDTPVIYPDIYYSTINKSIEELATQSNKRNFKLENRIASNILFLGDSSKEISSRTYNWMWLNLLTALQYKQEDYIINHWETAHQFFSFNLERIPPIFVKGSFEPNNTEKQEKRKIERKAFLDFHIVLCALLLHTENNKCLKRTLTYTTSQPAKYELIPEGIGTIYSSYVRFMDFNDPEFYWISSFYPFPDLRGLSADGIIKQRIGSYLALLFIRQYTLPQLFTHSNPLSIPQSPAKQSEKWLWLNNLDRFLDLIKKHLENRELMRTLGYDFLNDDWCSKEKIDSPEVIIQKLKTNLEKDYESQKINAPVSAEKIENFKNSAIEIFQSEIPPLILLNNTEDITGKFTYYNFEGNSTIKHKDIFVEEPEIPSLNFHTAFPYSITRNFREFVIRTFIAAKSKTFLLKPEDIFRSIEKIAHNPDYVLISFGVDVEHYVNNNLASELSLSKFKEIEIHNFSGINGEASLFLLKKINLPNIIGLKINDEDIRKFSLERLSENLELYFSILDLNKAEKGLIDYVKKKFGENDYSKTVLVNLFVHFLIKWRLNPEVIQLVEYSQYRQEGLPNTIDDVSFDFKV